MKKPVKQSVSIALILAAVTTMATGCQGNAGGESGKTDANGIKTFSFYQLGATTAIDLSNTTVGKEITKKTGVKLKCDYQVGGDQATIATTQTASSDYDDFLNCGNEFDVYRDAGALVPLEDYIEKYGTNIKKWYGNDLKKLKDPKTGHIYTLSPSRKPVTPLYATAGFYVQKRVLAANNYPRNMTLDQFFTMLENFVKKNPTYQGKQVIPFEARGDKDGLYLISNVGNYLAGRPNTGGSYFDADGTAHNFALASCTHDYLKKLNEEALKGIVDSNIFAQTQDQEHANIANGRALAFYDERWSITQQIQSLEQQKMYDEVPIAINVTFDGSTNESYNGISSITASQGVCISKSCKDPVAAFQFLDAMCSEDIMKLVNWGIEGQDYEMKDGKMTLTDKQLARMDDTDYAQKQGVGYWWVFPHPNLDADTKFSDGNAISPQNTETYVSSKYKSYEKEVLKAYNIPTFYEMFKPSQDSKFGFGWDITIPDSMTDVKTASQKSSELTQRYLPKLIFAKSGEFESVWESYKKDMTACHYDASDAYLTEQAKKRIQDWN
ncbi:MULTISPECIES: type 2 periplasmic-binding domain-containing protein [Caproicibacterium]|uniref:Extracellular solute-binding protein n=1 Tax=Caproicibacterium argilliputei TaxID=3030016 RepID=A0AA97DBH6_9FIRM|nr:extracellular solute-binding protein [Caproicibacterium argilliputei]WOC32729.1 extracellular solute-binding protein [Caproicibacterium argilliputei]